MNMQPRGECRRCLLKDLSKDEYFASIYEYIESLSEEEKAPKAEYEARLEKCKGCDYLVNGMCRHCGCFVEVRAIKKNMHCPGIPSLW